MSPSTNYFSDLTPFPLILLYLHLVHFEGFFTYLLMFVKCCVPQGNGGGLLSHVSRATKPEKHTVATNKFNVHFKPSFTFKKGRLQTGQVRYMFSLLCILDVF